MKPRRNHQVIFVCLVLLFICAGLWTVLNRAEPKYQGKTTQDWIYSIARGEVEGGFLPEMIGEIPHRFTPVLIDALEKVDSPAYRVQTKWHSLAPEMIQELLPRPLDPFRLMTTANTGIDEILLKHPNLKPELEKQLPRLRRLVKSQNVDIFAAAADLICSILTGEPYPHEQPEKYLDHPEFLVRIAAGLQLYGSGKHSNHVQLVSVLVEGLTNQASMEELFGGRATELRQSLSKSLKQSSPEIVEKYKEYLK